MDPGGANLGPVGAVALASYVTVCVGFRPGFLVSVMKGLSFGFETAPFAPVGEMGNHGHERPGPRGGTSPGCTRPAAEAGDTSWRGRAGVHTTDSPAAGEDLDGEKTDTWWNARCGNRKPVILERYGPWEDGKPHPADHFARALGVILQEMQKDHDAGVIRDHLGEIYETEGAAEREMAQFFTPMPPCELMAQMIVDENAPEDARIADPACGSGRLFSPASGSGRRASSSVSIRMRPVPR